MSKNIKLKKLIKEDMTYAPDKQNLGVDTERFGNYKIHKFKNLYHAVGKDLDLTAYDNNGKIIAGGIDQNTFKAKSYENIIQHLVSFYKANPDASSVDLSDRETGESLAAMQRTKFDEQNLKEIEVENKNIDEDAAFEKNYLPNSIKYFVSKSDTSSPYKPQIKLHWSDGKRDSDTKWLSVTWDMIAKLIDAMKG